MDRKVIKWVLAVALFDRNAWFCEYLASFAGRKRLNLARIRLRESFMPRYIFSLTGVQKRAARGMANEAAVSPAA